MSDDFAQLDLALSALRARAKRIAAPTDIAGRVAGRIGAGSPAAIDPRERGDVLRLVDSMARDPAARQNLNAAPTRVAFLAAFVRLGAERGCAFSTAAAAAVLSTLRAANDDGELSDDQLQAVAGGANQALNELWSVFARLP